MLTNNSEILAKCACLEHDIMNKNECCWGNDDLYQRQISKCDKYELPPIIGSTNQYLHINDADRYSFLQTDKMYQINDGNISLFIEYIRSLCYGASKAGIKKIIIKIKTDSC